MRVSDGVDISVVILLANREKRDCNFRESYKEEKGAEMKSKALSPFETGGKFQWSRRLQRLALKDSRPAHHRPLMIVIGQASSL